MLTTYTRLPFIKCAVYILFYVCRSVVSAHTYSWFGWNSLDNTKGKKYGQETSDFLKFHFFFFAVEDFFKMFMKGTNFQNMFCPGSRKDQNRNSKVRDFVNWNAWLNRVSFVIMNMAWCIKHFPASQLERLKID